MYAVIDDRGDDVPEVYVFSTEDEALRFAAWLVGDEGFDQLVHPVIVPPPGWNKEDHR